MDIKNLVNENTIFFIDEKNKFKVIENLIEKGVLLNKIEDKPEFKRAIESREQLMSTGIGLGIAIPHAKIEHQKDFFVITGILKNNVEWDSIDHKPVRLVFLIGGPANDQNQYLKILSKLILTVKDNAKREKMLKSDHVDLIATLFT